MAPRSFKTTVIAVSGTFPGYKQADIKALVEQHGATFSSSVTDQCTHLITTQKDVEKKGTKYQAASKSATCQIVSIDWLVESAAKKKPIAEKPYLLDASSTADGIAADGADDTKQNGKRPTRKAATKAAGKAADDADDAGSQDANGDDKKAVKKGAKSAATAKTDNKRAIKDEEDVDDEADDKASVTKKPKNSQKASSKSLVVPVDQNFLYEMPTFKNPQVYIDKSNLIWDATLNQTNSTANNNKFYRIQILTTPDAKNYVTWTRWGRVGENGQSASLGDGTLDGAKKWFEKKFKDKSGLAWVNRLSTPRNNKYTFLERNYEEDDEEVGKEEKKTVKKEPTDDCPPVESKLEKPIQDLMAFIFNQQHINSALASMSYDAQKLPLGKLSDRTLKAGFSVLKELAELLVDPSLAISRYGTSLGPAQENLSNRYFTLIPHVFGRQRPPVLVSDAMIRKEVELLEALTDMDVANEILKDSKQADEIHPLDRQFQSLGMEEMTRLDHKSSEFSELSDYLNNSRGSTHNQEYKVIDIFRIERQGETDRFTSSPFSNLQNSDRRLLWHGSRSTNFGGILSQGLRIAPPEAPVNGYMFGKGVYLADTSSKSANYCCASNSANTGLLLLCDAELGAPMFELADSDYHAGENAKKEGKIATLGMGRNIPGGWKDAGVVNGNLEGVKVPDVGRGSAVRGDANVYLQYNEYIVYDVAQIRQRYLFYVRMH